MTSLKTDLLYFPMIWRGWVMIPIEIRKLVSRRFKLLLQILVLSCVSLIVWFNTRSWDEFDSVSVTLMLNEQCSGTGCKSFSYLNLVVHSVRVFHEEFGFKCSFCFPFCFDGLVFCGSQFLISDVCQWCLGVHLFPETDSWGSVLSEPTSLTDR